MKKVFFLVAVLSVMLVSCTKSSTVETTTNDSTVVVDSIMTDSVSMIPDSVQ